MSTKIYGKFMPAKFKSICPETGDSILKGNDIFYSYLTKKAYSQYSRTFKKNEELEAINTKREATKEARPADYIPDPAELVADNWYNATYLNH